MSSVLAEGVLTGVDACVAFEAGGGVASRLASLGASVTAWDAAPGAGEADDAAAVAAAAGLSVVDVLVVDAGSRFRAFDGAPVDRLRAAIDDSFVVVRAVVHHHWIEPEVSGGKVVLLAPAADDGDHAGACGAALENTVRTLSVEWARFGVRLVAVVPRSGSDADAVADLISFLASPGGDYYSGCVLRPGAAT